MATELTPAVGRAVEAAQRHARAGNAESVTPLHLLAGLLEEDEGSAASLVIGAGLDLGAFRTAWPPAGEVSSLPLPLAPAASAVMASARDHGRDLDGDPTVTSTALLHALLEVPEVVRALEQAGFHGPRFAAQVRQAPVLAPVPDEPLQLDLVTEQIDTARILDASANRAREALRVIEDYCRFVTGDAFLSGQVKELRHDLASALGLVPASLLLEARETLRDVGTRLTTDQEGQRASPGEVARINLKRLQEALRSLEEYGKIHTPLLAGSVEQFRYRAYTLERALLLGANARQQLQGARLYVLLSRASCLSSLEWTIEEAAGGGASIVQLREKDIPDRELLALASEVRRWTRQAGLLFIVNDRPDIARLVGADGVHLGQDDLPVKEARRIMGEGALIGVSTHDLGQVRQAVLDGASYIGVGPVFPSATKRFEDFPGLEFVRQAFAETSLPAFAIGGVGEETIEAAVRGGARRVAVGAAVARAEEPRKVAATLMQALAEGSKG